MFSDVIHCSSTTPNQTPTKQPFSRQKISRQSSVVAKKQQQQQQQPTQPQQHQQQQPPQLQQHQKQQHQHQKHQPPQQQQHQKNQHHQQPESRHTSDEVKSSSTPSNEDEDRFSPPGKILFIT